jgi:hypothetical protein
MKIVVIGGTGLIGSPLGQDVAGARARDSSGGSAGASPFLWRHRLTRFRFVSGYLGRRARR